MYYYIKFGVILRVKSERLYVQDMQQWPFYADCGYYRIVGEFFYAEF